MKLGIMQPYFFPYIGYWQLMNAVDKYVVYDDVNYIKGGWANRNNILVDGKPHRINLLLKKASPNKLFNETEILHDFDEKKLLKTISIAYAKAPYYNEVFPLITQILNNTEICLSKYLIDSFKIINQYIGITTDLIVSSELKKDCSLKGEDKVIHICKLLNADEYYNAIGGTELYNRERFAENNIELHFLKTNDIIYPQFKNEFVPNLSIIDVMMFNSKEQIKNMLEEFTLV